jgi:hypothetical protein
MSLGGSGCSGCGCWAFGKFNYMSRCSAIGNEINGRGASSEPALNGRSSISILQTRVYFKHFMLQLHFVFSAVLKDLHSMPARSRCPHMRRHCWASKSCKCRLSRASCRVERRRIRALQSASRRNRRRSGNGRRRHRTIRRYWSDHCDRNTLEVPDVSNDDGMQTTTISVQSLRIVYNRSWTHTSLNSTPKIPTNST